MTADHGFFRGRVANRFDRTYCFRDHGRLETASVPARIGWMIAREMALRMTTNMTGETMSREQVPMPTPATSNQPATDSQASERHWGKILFGILAIAALLYAGRSAGAYVPQFATWVDGLGFWGPIVFMLGYAGATLAFIPGSVLTLASGAIFGLLGATIVYFYTYRDYFGAQGQEVLRSMLVVLVLNLVIGVSMANVDNWGHLGGLVGGAVMAWGLMPSAVSL